MTFVSIFKCKQIQEFPFSKCYINESLAVIGELCHLPKYHMSEQVGWDQNIWHRGNRLRKLR